ncbi:leucine-rich repeat-containing protein 63 [Pleurodeles waltl]
MEIQFSARHDILKPSILLRRPLPPKFLAPLNPPLTKTAKNEDWNSKREKSLKDTSFPSDISGTKVLENIANDFKLASAGEQRTNKHGRRKYLKDCGTEDLENILNDSTSIKYEDQTSEHRAPTPATSQVTAFEVDPFYYGSKGQRYVYPKYTNILPDRTQREHAISPLKHSGPDGFLPHRSYIRPLVQLQHFLENESLSETSPEFILDVVSQPSSGRGPVKESLTTPFNSPHNYNVLMELLSVRLQQNKQNKINVISLSSNSIPKKTSRIPQRQMILEKKLKDALSLEEYGEDSLNSLTVARDFHHGGLTKLRDVTNAYSGGETITPSEFAVLDSFAQGGLSLELKAYFIDRLPDLTLIAHSLVYLNLSFNDFQHFPAQIYDLENLEVLKLRNNPIKEIPPDVQRLRKLKYLVMSFCLLSSLPPGLFLLANLEVLDVSYNSISSIPNDISNLSLLKFLNVEGNQLPALPSGALKLHLKQLRVSNNMMHPLLWNENSWIKPQRLTDLAALTFSRNNLLQFYSTIPKDAEQILSKFTVCDCCRQPMYGQGLRFIRACKKIFGVRMLPFIFTACSPSCYENFMSQKDTLFESLYGIVPENET